MTARCPIKIVSWVLGPTGKHDGSDPRTMVFVCDEPITDKHWYHTRKTSPWTHQMMCTHERQLAKGIKVCLCGRSTTELEQDRDP